MTNSQECDAKMSNDKKKIVKFDAEAFAKDIRSARDETRPTPEEEEQHLAKLEMYTTALGLTGLLLAVRGAMSPVSMLALGIYKYAKFAILAHHSLHGGWGRERRGWYAQGVYRRVVDWLDWIFPQAWIVEHNKVHHYRLNEDADPDFVERNLDDIRSWDIPLPLKYLVVSFTMLTWKWFYYMSNTAKLLHADTATKEQAGEVLTLKGVVMYSIQGSPWHRAVALDLMLRIMSPTLLLNFVAIPFVAGLFTGSYFCWMTFANIVGAELVTNLWAFVTIVTNHAGGDLWWFDGPCKADVAEFYLRAVLGSTAYHAGSDLVDYLHGYLNYQGEHHAFPDLSPLHYQRLHPQFKKVCASYGVPYVQEPVWTRTRKTMEVMTGLASHKRLSGLAQDHPEMWSTLAN